MIDHPHVRRRSPFRFLRLPLACSLVFAAPWVSLFSRPDPLSGMGIPDTILLAASLLLPALSLAWIALRLNVTLRTSHEGPVDRGTGLDVSLGYAFAVALGTWQAAVGTPAQGIAVTGAGLLAVCLIGSAVDEDLRRGLIPALPLALSALSAALAAASHGRAWVPIALATALVLVVLPSQLRQRSTRFPHAEAVAGIPPLVLGLAFHWSWLAAAGLIAAGAVLYSRWNPQPSVLPAAQFAARTGNFLLGIQLAAMVTAAGLSTLIAVRAALAIASELAWIHELPHANRTPLPRPLRRRGVLDRGSRHGRPLPPERPRRARPPHGRLPRPRLAPRTDPRPGRPRRPGAHSRRPPGPLHRRPRSHEAHRSHHRPRRNAHPGAQSLLGPLGRHLPRSRRVPPGPLRAILEQPPRPGVRLRP